MTEEEWLSCDDPISSFTKVRNIATDRKRRLFAVACCRNIWDVMKDERCRNAVELSEQAADTHVDERLMDRVSSEAEGAYQEEIFEQIEEMGDFERALSERRSSACSAASYASNSPAIREEDVFHVVKSCCGAVKFKVAESTFQAALLRDIFGNPFRPVAFDPAWRTSTAIGIASAIYEDRAFDRMPILADAIQDAGCEYEDILTHCRGVQQHVRGCWVVDLVLGKE